MGVINGTHSSEVDIDYPNKCFSMPICKRSFDVIINSPEPLIYSKKLKDLPVVIHFLESEAHMP